MRVLTLSAAAALVLIAAGPALAGDPRGGGHGGGPCCAPPPPPPPSCCNHGGGSRNVNINVNASAQAFAEASATSHFNARAYDVGGIRGRGYGGGTVYVGGGYGGDAGGYGYVGAPVYYDIDRRALACASAPFGYVVTGFGRDDRRPPSCGRRYVDHDHGYDRGGRYGHSERHDSYEERSYESYESYEEYGSFEAYEAYGAYGRDGRHEDAGYGIGDYERGYIDGRRDCDCREPAPYPPPYLPEPPRYEPPAPPARPHRPRRPRHDAPPPRQQYRQEPGERG